MSAFQFPLRAEDFRAPADLRGLGGKALVVGVVAAIAVAVGAMLDPARFFPAYLAAWLLWFSVGAGCLGLLLIHSLSGGRWGTVLRRPMEAGARTLPLLGLLAVPLFVGLERLFVWADHAKVEADHLLHHKAAYLNPAFFIGRTVFVIVVFSLLAYRLSSLSAAQDRAGDARGGRAWSMQRIAGVGLLFFVLAMTFMGFDWLMSLDPRWFSSLYGAIFMVGSAIAALAFLTLIAAFLVGREPMRAVYTSKRFHDFGTLLFAFVMFFTYLGISQLIIIYQGNLPEEVLWFQHRFHGGWGWIAWALLIFHFFFPFLILLHRAVKRKAGALAKVAGFLLFMRWVDLIWQSRPSLVHEFALPGLGLSWIDLAAPVAVGGLWIFFFVRELASRPLLPIGSPAIEEALGHD